MGEHVPKVACGILVLCGIASQLSPPAAQLLVKELCAPGEGMVGTHWISLPTGSDIATAEELCAAIPFAATVTQFFPDTPSPTDTGTGRRWTYECATEVCTPGSALTPPSEPDCASACFCVDDGEGFEVRTTAAGVFDINGCDTFATVTLPAGGQSYLTSIPFDTTLQTFNQLGVHFNLRTLSGSVTGINGCTGVATSCTIGTVSCNAALLVPGDAYRLRDPGVNSGYSAPNPVSCDPPFPPAPAAECPIGEPVIAGEVISWDPPAGCPLVPPLLYDVLRGDVACLRNACRQAVTPPTPPCPTCVLLLDDGAATMAMDPDLPDPEAAFFYLVRVEGGTWNDTSGVRCIDRDFMLADGCP